MIDTIQTGGTRGRDITVELDRLTLLVGPNGAGKTSVSAAAFLALQGYVPGSDTKRAATNMATVGPFADLMAPRVVMGVAQGGHAVTRAFKRKKDGTISTTIIVDGNTAAGTAADGMIAMAVGKGPHLVDMPAFYALTPTKMRQQVLSVACPPERQAQLLKDEADAREKKNGLAAERKAKEATVAELTRSLNQLCPPGTASESPAALEKLLKERETQRDEAKERITQADANQRLRTQREKTKASLAEAKQALERGQKKADEQGAAYRKACDDLETAKVKAASFAKADGSQQVIVEFHEAFTALVEQYMPRLPATIGALLDQFTETIAKAMPETDAIAEKAAADAQRAVDKLAALIEQLAEEGERIVQGIERCKDIIRTHEETLANDTAEIGPAATDEDRAVLAGIEKAVADYRARIATAQKAHTVRDQIVKAQAAVQAVTQNEEKAKEALKTAQQAQADAIEEAQAIFRLRSENALPVGFLRIVDEGTDFRIVWDMGDGKVVDRASLSGGEAAIFDPVFGHVLAPEATIFIELAEVDDDNMTAVLTRLQDADYQIVGMTCHPPVTWGATISNYEVPSAWKVVTIAE